ncbi:hypothetical protein, partial [Rufibacter soli]
MGSLKTIIVLMARGGAQAAPSPLPPVSGGDSGLSLYDLMISSMVNLKDYCVGDGVTNDAQGLINAIATGKDVYVTPGYEFLISNNLDFGIPLQQYQRIIGAGRRSVLKVDNNNRGIHLERFCVARDFLMRGSGKNVTD